MCIASLTILIPLLPLVLCTFKYSAEFRMACVVKKPRLYEWIYLHMMHGRRERHSTAGTFVSILQFLKD